MTAGPSVRWGRQLWVSALVLTSACGEGAHKADTPPPRPLATDTGTADLSKLSANLPPPSSDTFTPIATTRLKVESIPDAPPDLMDAAEREEGISRFCYQEYGQKVDPKLVGAVALVVTVQANAIQSARVGAEQWSSSVGEAVDNCLVQKVPQAWKLLPGARVPAGRYVIQLRFRPS